MRQINEFDRTPSAVKRNNLADYIANVLILYRCNFRFPFCYRIHSFRQPIDRLIAETLERVVHVVVDRTILPSNKISANHVPILLDQQERVTKKYKLLQFQI